LPELSVVVDSHEDIASAVVQLKRDFLLPLNELRSQDRSSKAEGTPTVCLPELVRGNVRIVFATLWVSPCGYKEGDDHICYRTAEEAYSQARDQLAYYRSLEKSGHVRIIENRNDLEEHLESETPRVGMVLLMEGADPIRTPKECREWFELGVRIVGPAWRQTRYSGGTFAPGPLTPEGRQLMGEMEACGMILDTSHAAEASFFEELDLFHGRVIASHSNCRVFVPTDRQLSDEMIRALVSRKAVIGSVIYNTFLDPQWVERGKVKSEVTLATVLKHMDHVCEIAGNRKQIGIGSDFDGGFGRESIPAELDSVADLQKFGPALREHGFSDAEARGVLGENWIHLLKEALP
jgi:membrane dipeptidase